MKRIRVLPLPPGIPEPAPLRKLRQSLGLPEVYVEVPDEVSIKLAGVNLEVGMPPKLVLSFEVAESDGNEGAVIAQAIVPPIPPYPR